MARILIVDDEAKLGEVLGEMLESAGHVVVRVDGGREALQHIAAGDLDIVISDLRMPGIDGMTVLRETRKQSPHTDVMLMTAYATAQNAVDAMKEGATDYLIKPFAMDELRMRVAR